MPDEIPQPKIFILARRIEEVKDTEPYSVTEHPCMDCGHTCAISPSSVKAIAEHDLPVKCFQCKEKMGEQPLIYAQLPESILEMRVQKLTRQARERRN